MAKYALLVGVDDYDPRLPLVCCTPVQALDPLREALKSNSVGGFKQVHVLRNPDRAQLGETLVRLFAAPRRGDLLLLFVAAAGIVDLGGRAQLLLPGHTGTLESQHALSLATVLNSIQLSPCIRRVVLLDVGFTAAAAGEASAQAVLARETMKLPGTAVLASAAGTAFGLDAQARSARRLFGPWLTQVLTTADPHCPRLLTVSALYERLRRETPPDERFDTPRLWLGHMSRGALVLARNPALPARAAPPGPAAAVSADAGARNARRRRHGVLHRRRARRRRRCPRRRLPVRLAGLALLGPIALFLAGDGAHRDLQVAVTKMAHQAAPNTFKQLFTHAHGAIFSDPLVSGGRGPALMALPGGFFTMGSYAGEPERHASEGPVYRVGVEPFALGIAEVTFAEYDRFARATGRSLPGDAGWGRGSRPVVNVSWDDAVAFTRWLSTETGKRYFLPTEAQWEYAARAATSTPFSTGGCIHTDQANYNGVFDYAGCGARTGIYRGQTLPATALPPNPWGLYHMHGNVWEWVRDCWQPRHVKLPGIPKRGADLAPRLQRECGRRAMRGGGWRFEPGYARSAARVWSKPATRNRDIGFRVARSLD